MRLLIALTATAALLLLAAPGYGAPPVELSQTPTAAHGIGWTTAVIVNPPVVAGRLAASTPFFRPKGTHLPSADTLTPTPTPTATFKLKGTRLPSADTSTPTPTSR